MTAALPWIVGALGLYQVKKASDAIKNVQAPAPPPAPVAPPPAAAVVQGEPLKNVQEATAQAREDVMRRKSAGLGGTNKTGGLGVPGSAATQGKSLLGQ